MKILLISMTSIHFFRWTEQLKDSGHKVFWVDVFDSNIYNERINFVEQTIGWRNKIKYPGRYWIKKNLPNLFDFVNSLNQRPLSEIVERKIIEIQPDVVHSFVLFSACSPILTLMQKYPDLPWIYSAWGNDLYYLQNNPDYFADIKKVLPRLNYMFADCTRDYYLAKKYGFKGEYLGTFPTGGGYELAKYETYIKKAGKRIIIKGYQGELGRCIPVLKAIENLEKKLLNFEILVFGANEIVKDYAQKTGLLNWNNFKLFFHIPHIKVLEHMGLSNIYIGNNITDGTPNTLLEAIIMECFPIQSNPGGATSELIAHGHNGLLIEDPESSEEIALHINRAIEDKALVTKAINHNNLRIKPKLGIEYIKELVIERYNYVEKKLL